MRINTRKPVTPASRTQQYIVGRGFTKKKSNPEKGLTAPIRKSGGRNVYGRITVRHIGGGAKRKYRKVDFLRSHKNVTGVVKEIEYDPNRNVEICLVFFANGAKEYVLRAQGMQVGSTIISGEEVDVSVGNSLPLHKIPVGFFVHNVELFPNRGGVIAKSGGTSVQIVSKDTPGMTMLKMPSSEVRLVSSNCWATVGVLSGAEQKNVSLGKAGRRRNMGVRPTVRGMAMNPVDHPMGGGEGRSKSGSHPTSPWGKPCKGAITRRRKSSLIIQRRGKKRSK